MKIWQPLLLFGSGAWRLRWDSRGGCDFAFWQNYPTRSLSTRSGLLSYSKRLFGGLCRWVSRGGLVLDSHPMIDLDRGCGLVKSCLLVVILPVTGRFAWDGESFRFSKFSFLVLLPEDLFPLFRRSCLYGCRFVTVSLTGSELFILFLTGLDFMVVVVDSNPLWVCGGLLFHLALSVVLLL